MTGARSLRSRRRRDLILSVLAAAEFPLTTKAIASSVGDTYSAVYSALRTMCGSHTLRYDQITGAVNVDGYPVIWHSWDDPDRGSYITWELTPAERDARTAETATLEALLMLPAAGEDS